ncbi:MAG: DUF3093 domain-containing protein [Spirochaetaceae bacterium]|jgi:hypothetical protein|nr:DUF3093 domain-containing protein [Spirochaetaceae bacterium]
MRTYDERLTAPVGLWVGVWVMSLVLGVSFYAALGPVAGLLAVAVPGVLMSVVLVRSAAVVRVEDGHLTAGPARIPVDALGPVQSLDAEQARHTRGPGSDPAAYHLIRGWVPAGVRAAVVDPGDATPYWFVASRRPDELAAAIEAARAAHRSGA